MFKLLALILLSVIKVGTSIVPAIIQLQWNYPNYTWPSQVAYNEAISNGYYIPFNNVLSGIKIWKDRVYLSTPRWLNGVPASLVSTSTKAVSASPFLNPYPNWKKQKLDDCSAFQFVLSMEIDPKGRMWVIDNGRTEIFTSSPRAKCPPRLVVLDLEDKGRELLIYEFPEDVAHRNSVFLNDIVVDQEDGGFAYITDTDPNDPGIIVFSLTQRMSWKVRDASMKGSKDAEEIIVNGTKITGGSDINGIALSHASKKGERLVYYCALSSFEVFTVPTSALKNRLIDVTDYVKSLGRKSSQSDGIGMSSTGVLYYGLVSEDAVGIWKTGMPPFDSYQTILVQNHTTMQWPNSFGFDSKNRVWFITNRTQKFRMHMLDVMEVNYRVIIADVHSKSYLYYEDGSAPEYPSIHK